MQFAEIVNIVWNVPLTSSDRAYGVFNSYQIVMYQMLFWEDPFLISQSWTQSIWSEHLICYGVSRETPKC